MKKVFAALILITALPGCDSNSATAEVVNEGQGSAAVSSSSAASAEKSAVSLGDNLINYQAALGRVPAVVSMPGPCPFLSDDGAKSAVKTTYELERKEVSNSGCRWSYNAGFSIEVTVKPIDESIPVAQRRYNLGVDTELDTQDGPGNHAVLVSDTAFGKPVPFGYGFELNDDAIFIHVTGMQTDKKRLSATAVEIAKMLPDAPVIEPQRRSESVTFEPCSIWQNQAIQNALQLADNDTVTSHASGNSCIYKAYGGDSGMATTLTVRIGELDVAYHKKAIERGHAVVTGFDFPVSATIEESDFGTYTKIVGYLDGGAIEIFILDAAKAQHKDVSKQLLQNVASRIES